MEPMKNPSSPAFTLIELMVVISIIALFASITFASLTGVRARAQEATIKSELKSVKSQAELSYNNTGDYSTAGSAVSAIIDGINTGGGTAAFYTYDNTHYAVSVRLNSNPSKNWSVSDQANTITWDTAADISSGTLNWSNANIACSNAGGRLPTIEELKALCDAGGMKSAGGFKNYSPYWSGTENASAPVDAWYVFTFDCVQNAYLYKTNPGYVRCVR